MRIDDETLSAYLDGELTDEQALVLRQQLQSDAELATRLVRIRDGDQRFRGLLSTTLPPPSASLNRLLMAPTGKATRRGVGWLAWWPGHAHLIPALSFGVLAIVGVALWMGLGPGQAPGPAPWIDQTLEQARSGATHRVDGLELVVLESYHADDGRYCRRYVLSDSTDSHTRWACRDKSGRWTTSQPLSDIVTATDQADTYRLASGDTPPAKLRRLTPTEEAQLLARQWQAPSGVTPQ